MRVSKGCLLAAAAAAAAFAWPLAAQVKYVAVVETEVDAQSGASSKLNKAEVRQITAELRREAVKNLPSGKYNIMTTETVIAQGGAVLDECMEENCVITLGNKIGANYIVRGTISKFQTKLTLSVEIYETEDGHLVASSDPIRSEKPAELLEKASAACAEMFKAFEAAQSAAQKLKKKPSEPDYPPAPAAAAPKAAEYKAPPPAAQPSPAAAAAAPAPAAQAPAAKKQPDGPAQPLTDRRNGITYKTTVIGGRRWMAENLNFTPAQGGNSWCYNGDNAYCAKYGRLYDWGTAKTACPDGWRLPAREDWNELVETAGGSSVAGRKLKARSGWKGGSGADSYGFASLPGGNRYPDGSSHDANFSGYWWTSAPSVGSYAYARFMSYSNDYVNENGSDKGGGFSVRCVEN